MSNRDAEPESEHLAQSRNRCNILYTAEVITVGSQPAMSHPNWGPHGIQVGSSPGPHLGMSWAASWVPSGKLGPIWVPIGLALLGPTWAQPDCTYMGPTWAHMGQKWAWAAQTGPSWTPMTLPSGAQVDPGGLPTWAPRGPQFG